VDISLLSEKLIQVERDYLDKNSKEYNHDVQFFKLQEELGELIQAYLMMTGRSQNRGLSNEEIEVRYKEELADLVVHCLLIAKHDGIDIEKEISDKWLKYL
jgi:NTP pyrophosphatase (non-canonical NTP hydrolase)